MNRKRLLIIDDSEIDRKILINILGSDFNITEADNGYSGLEILLDKTPHIDAVLLDISMPVLDGFDILELMANNNLNNIPVILITAEATESNVHKAIEYNVCEFILKPFEPDIILTRLRALLDVELNLEGENDSEDLVLSENEITESNNYISKLENIYKAYLKNNNKNDEQYMRVEGIMEIILSEYAHEAKKTELNNSAISLISKAAYFYDIGQMAVPANLLDTEITDETDQKTYESHTIVGADIIWLNHSTSCRYFVRICGDICMHHHERFDGKGFPHMIKGDDNMFYTQMCSASIKFDKIFSKRRPTLDDTQFDFVLSEMSIDNGEFSQEILSLFKKCQLPLLAYYRRLHGLQDNF